MTTTPVPARSDRSDSLKPSPTRLLPNLKKDSLYRVLIAPERQAEHLELPLIFAPVSPAGLVVDNGPARVIEKCRIDVPYYKHAILVAEDEWAFAEHAMCVRGSAQQRRRENRYDCINRSTGIVVR